MKKPLIILKGYKNICALVLCLALSAWAIGLLLDRDDSLSVFAPGDRAAHSLYELAASFI